MATMWTNSDSKSSSAPYMMMLPVEGKCILSARQLPVFGAILNINITEEQNIVR